MMEYQVPLGRSAIIDQIFADASNRNCQYNDTKNKAARYELDLVSLRDSRNQDATLLHIAAGFGRVSWVRGLIIDGADVDARDKEGKTPLHSACNHAHVNVAGILIKAGADVNLADHHKGWPALHFALAPIRNNNKVQPEYWDVVELLLSYGADPYQESFTKKSSLARICDADQRRRVRLKHLLNLLESHSCDSPRVAEPSREIIIKKYMKVNDFFELIIEGDVNIDILEQIITPHLMSMRLASRGNITPLHRAAGYNQLKTAQLFIDFGAKVDATDDHGRIALHNAAEFGHIDMIELLVKAGADIDKRDLEGLSPIHFAASNCTHTASLLLITLGASKNILSLSGKLPFDLANSDDVKEVLKLEKVQTVPSENSKESVYATASDPVVPDNERNCSLQTQLIATPDELMLNSDSDERLFSNPQHQIKIVKLDEKDSRYQLVANRMLHSIVFHSNDSGGRFSTYEILKIELILHEKVWTKYRLACKRLELDYGIGSKNERLLFHGSNLIDKIQTYGFDERYAQRNGMFGAGLYFGAHSSKSNQYTFGFGNGCKEHKDKSCYICERKVIYAQVALGKSLVSTEAIPDCAHAPPGYSSVTGLPETTEGLAYPEFVIYNGDQAYPLFVITYKIKL